MKYYGLVGEYLYGRIFGEGENMILDTTQGDLRIYWCLDKVEVSVDDNFVSISNSKIENLSGAYARVPKDSFPLFKG